MQTEIYQNELYRAGAYFFTSDYEINENFDLFIYDIEIATEKHNVHIFVELFQIVSTYESECIIYGNNEIIRNILKDVMNVEEETYTALTKTYFLSEPAGYLLKETDMILIV